MDLLYENLPPVGTKSTDSNLKSSISIQSTAKPSATKPSTIQQSKPSSTESKRVTNTPIALNSSVSQSSAIPVPTDNGWNTTFQPIKRKQQTSSRIESVNSLMKASIVKPIPIQQSQDSSNQTLWNMNSQKKQVSKNFKVFCLLIINNSVENDGKENWLVWWIWY